MARMLEALKRLEARTPRPAERCSAPVAKQERSSESTALSTRAATATAADVVEPELETAASQDVAAAEMAELTVAVSDPVWQAGGEWLEPDIHVAALGAMIDEALTPLPVAIEAPRNFAAPNPAPAVQPASTGRGATAVERAAVRFLSDPIRSRPLVDLADRLSGDIKQSSGKTAVFVGIGAQSTAHQTLLYAGMLLAEKRHGKVLLVDADLVRRSFSTALERGATPGLANLVYKTATVDLCQPLSTSDLWFLSAGGGPNADLSTAGARLEEALQKLGEEFAIVLIDGGRTEDLPAAALARHADATYLVVQLGTVDAEAAQGALRDMRASGARVLGAIAT